MANIVRVQFEVTDKQLEAIENLKDITGLRTKKDLLNSALTLLEWFVGERKAGRIVGSLDQEQKLREIRMPGVL